MDTIKINRTENKIGKYWIYHGVATENGIKTDFEFTHYNDLFRSFSLYQKEIYTPEKTITKTIYFKKVYRHGYKTTVDLNGYKIPKD